MSVLVLFQYPLNSVAMMNVTVLASEGCDTVSVSQGATNASTTCTVGTGVLPGTYSINATVTTVAEVASGIGSIDIQVRIHGCGPPWIPYAS